MDHSTASYYRAILFADGTAQQPLPATLVKLHAWAVKRNQALGLGGMITKAVALSVAMTWLSSTEDGRKFTSSFTPLGDLFGIVEEEPQEEVDETEETVVGAEDWDSLPAESDVIVTMPNKSTKPAKFLSRRGNWVDVRIDGEVKHFRITKVQIVGA